MLALWGFVLLVCSRGQVVPNLIINKARLVKEVTNDIWEMFDPNAEVYIRCSHNGGNSWPIRVDLQSVDVVDKWYDGPWELGSWEYEYGSILYCQIIESDKSMPSFLSFLDQIIDPDDFMGDTAIFMSDFVGEFERRIDFYWRKDVTNIDQFPRSAEIYISCEGCQGLKYKLPAYWSIPGSVWPEKIDQRCRFVQGIKAARLLAKGFCCMAGNYLLIGDGYCSDLYPYKTQACGFDFGDCCPSRQKDCWKIEGFQLAPSNEIMVPSLYHRQLYGSMDGIENCTALRSLPEETEDVRTFVKALEVTGMYDQIVVPLNGQVTLLAPTNKAFDLITMEYQLTQEDLFDLQSNIDLLKEVLEVHVFPEIFTLAGPQNVTTTQGVSMYIEELEIETEDGQSANIIPPGLPYYTCEGIVLLLDSVLIP